MYMITDVRLKIFEWLASTASFTGFSWAWSTIGDKSKLSPERDQNELGMSGQLTWEGGESEDRMREERVQ